MKSDLVEAIKHKSVNETQAIVAKTLNIEIKQAPKVTAQADESVRFEVSLTKAQWEKFNKMRELLSNKVTNGDWSELLEYLSDKVIQQKTGKSNNTQKSVKEDGNPDTEQEEMSLYQLKKFVLRRDGCCQYKNTEGKICGSKWHLEVDHIQPKWAGGKDVIENLRALCGNHNRHVYRKQANIKAM